MKQESFNLLVDGVPYVVSVIPFDFNGEMRFRISYNYEPEHIYTWDSSLGRITAIDDESSTIPDTIEQAIADRVQAMAG